MPMMCTRPRSASARHDVGGGAAHQGGPGRGPVVGPVALVVPGRWGGHAVPPAKRRCSSATREHVPGEDDVGVPRRRTARRPPTSRASRAGSVTRGTISRRIQSAVRSRSSTSSPPPACDDGQRVEPLLAVADRVGHVGRGQPDGGELGARHRPAPAQREVGGGVGVLHLLDVGHDDVGHAPGRRARRRLFFGPMTCSTCTPAARRPPTAPATARLIDCAPCEPPNTSRVGRSGRSPNRSRASSRSAARSSREIAGRSGMPMRGGVRQAAGLGGGEHVRGQARRAPVGQARLGVGLVHDDRDRQAPRGEVGRHGDVAAEADDDVGAAPVRAPAEAARTASRTRARRGHQGAVEPARQRHRRHEFERVAARRDERGVQALRGAERGDRRWSGRAGAPRRRGSSPARCARRCRRRRPRSSGSRRVAHEARPPEA